MKQAGTLVADRAVRSHLVVVSTPSLAFSSRIVEAHEPMRVQTFRSEFGRNQRGHVLQLAQEVRWAHAVRDEATASARGRERQTEEDRGSLDKEMLQDVIRRKL